ncbi:hypothetical protein KAFR_0F02840 [Kazachstania africana CBS 2517]|uniref:Postreplication repair E3 ubiquitin-protein ligase RAD18 n=1 Tax=Kazachstania africana (strain ATCC 22294 / BCRC 22015 / CBS 2517 / CECT 1963 / NBRC 1671 / NRRL Y-8276) TaxID=1071382 RepID=H2AWY0_KAZAF|nr:hypothetical protein KAFR_0F02840 [Kazachstania africana CBS 2517]CCF58880.1 hypothetical protein KAFR_0F02840 [Kazachstania africana CBS 2517]
MDQIISDASDFHDTQIPNISQLDALLRCHICKDFLKVPVLTPCGHTFCSICIREYINRQSKCPLCLNELRESMLRSEFLVNEIVQSFQSVRTKLLEVVKMPTISGSEDKSLIELGSDLESESGENIQSSKELESEEGDDDIQIVGTNQTKSTLRHNLRKTVSGPRINKSISSIESMFTKRQTNVRMAQCPICEDFYPIKTLERVHLDECLTLQSLGKKPVKRKASSTDTGLASKMTKAPSTSQKRMKSLTPPKDDNISHLERYVTSVVDTEHQRLPKLDFTAMSLSQIKQKLSALKLSTVGSKQDMIARYNHFELLWNSNFVDSMDPVSESELRRQLTSWEASNNSNNVNTNNNIGRLMMQTKKADTKTVEYNKLLKNFKNDKFSRTEWATLFNKEFKQLIKQARRNLEKDRQKLNDENDHEHGIEGLTEPSIENSSLFNKNETS